MPKKDEILK